MSFTASPEKWSETSGMIRQHPVWKTGALPIELVSQKNERGLAGYHTGKAEHTTTLTLTLTPEPAMPSGKLICLHSFEGAARESKQNEPSAVGAFPVFCLFGIDLDEAIRWGRPHRSAAGQKD